MHGRLVLCQALIRCNKYGFYKMQDDDWKLFPYKTCFYWAVLTGATTSHPVVQEGQHLPHQSSLYFRLPNQSFGVFFPLVDFEE